MPHPVTGDGARRSLSRRDLLRTAGLAAGAIALGGVTPAAARSALPGLGGAVDRATGVVGAVTEPLRLVRVWPTAGQRHLLAMFDDTHHVWDDGSVELLLWPGDLPKLLASGLRYEITVADVVARDVAAAEATDATVRTAARQPGETETGDYRHLADFEADLRDLARRFPDKARLLELPEKTLEGRTVYGLEIATDVDRRDGRPVFYNDGIHHAREWPAAEVPIMWAFDLLERYESDPRIRAIVDHSRNIVVPVVNPDGYHLSREFPVNQSLMGVAPLQLLQGQYVRKNRRSAAYDLTGQQLPGNLDSYGVDPNRNYAYAWGDNIGGSSSDPTTQTYRGTEPFSEPESRNVSHLFRTHQITAMITHHTSGDLVLWAWGDTTDDAPDNYLLEGIGRACAAYNGYRPQKSIDLYATTGTTSDYAYGAFASIGYTFEHAGSSFHPPYAATVPSMYARNREALMILCEEMCLLPEQRVAGRDLPAVVVRGRDADAVDRPFVYGTFNHAVVTGRLVDAAGNGVPGTVTIRKTFETLLWKDGNGGNPTGRTSVTESLETSMETDADGTFTYHVNPSTRPYLEFKGETEAYEITLAGPREVTRSVVVPRGGVTELGDVVVADGGGSSLPPQAKGRGLGFGRLRG